RDFGDPSFARSRDARIIAAMPRPLRCPSLRVALLLILIHPAVAFAEPWVTRDSRAAPRGPWRGALSRVLPQLYREFNGIDFGHARLAATLLRSGRTPADVETARVQVLEFIDRKPAVPPDESQIAPGF